MVTEASAPSFNHVFAAYNPSKLEALYYVLSKKNLAERDKWLRTAKLIGR